MVPGDGLEMSDSKCVTWNADSSIEQLVKTALPHSTAQSGDISDKLTIEYLARYHKVKVLWTHNLAKHLDLV